MPSNSGRIGPSYSPPGAISLSLAYIQACAASGRWTEGRFFWEGPQSFAGVLQGLFPTPYPHSCSHESKKALFWPPPKTRVGSTDWAWGCIWNSACSSWITQEGRKRRFVFPLNLATCMPPGGQKIELKLMSVASACNSENQRCTLANIHWNNAT